MDFPQNRFYFCYENLAFKAVQQKAFMFSASGGLQRN